MKQSLYIVTNEYDTNEYLVFIKTRGSAARFLTI